MITVYIDSLTPCLKDAITGDIVETEVIKITRKSFLKKFNRRNNWFVNWDSLANDNEIYALVIKGTVDIQGLVAIRPDNDANCLYVSWMVSAPQNNKLLTENVKYLGVGGHLFAIAAQRSFDYGFEGFLYGFAANEKLLKHYLETFSGLYLGTLHKFHFAIDSQSAHNIMEVYTYEWSNDEI